MPTYTVGPGKTYSTLQSALNAIPGNLAGTGIHEVIMDAGIYNTGNELIRTWTNANSTNYVWIHAALGHEHKGNIEAGVRLTSGAIQNSRHYDLGNFVRCDDLIFRDGSGASTLYLSGPGQILKNCIFMARSLSVAFSNFGTSPVSPLLINCLAIPRFAGQTPMGFSLANDNILYNCGAFGCSTGFYSGGGSANRVTMKNCWAANCTTTCFSTNFPNDVSSHNASTDNSAQGTNVLRNLTLAQFGFTSVSTSDFHISRFSSLFNSGVSVAAVTTDIDGQAITAWCIGPDCPPSPDPYQPTGSEPWKGQIEISDKPSEAKSANLRTIKGAPSTPSNSPSRTSDTKDFKPTTRSSDQTPPVERQKQGGREAEGYVLNGKKGQRTGFISLMPELNGYGAVTPGLGTGYLMPFMGETLALGKEFRDLDPVHSSRVNGTRRAMYQSPAGKVEFPVRSNDIVPLLQAHFQKRIGTTVVAGTTYYEFVPNKGRVSLSVGQFGTGSYNQADMTNAFSISAYKDISGNGILFKSGIVDKLAFKFHSVIEPSIEADFRFREGTLMGTQTSHPYGTYSGNREFSPTECSVDFMGLPVIDFEFVSDNQVENRSIVGDSRPIHKFGQYRLRGKATVDLGKTGLRNYGSVLSGSTFSVSATMHQSNHNRLVFDFPDCRVSDFPIGYQSIYSIPFEAFASDNGSTAPVKVGVWTQNYSATSFQPY